MSAPKVRVTQSILEKKFAPVTQNTANKIIYIELKIDELQQSVFNQFKRGYDVKQVINMLQTISMDFYKFFSIVLSAAVTCMMHVNKVKNFQPFYNHSPRIGE